MTARYQKQIRLDEIGELGQEKIGNASVLIIGAGGLGVMVATYLTAMGVGSIGICDFDLIEASNLHRQFHFTPYDLGKSKALVLARQLKLQNPEVDINYFVDQVDKNSIIKISENYQIICDCTDQALSRILINHYCATHNKILIHGAVSDWEGYLTVFHYQKGFSLNDIFEISDYLRSQNCSTLGVNSAICGLIGSYMVNETLKVILKINPVLEGQLLYINMLNYKNRLIQLHKIKNTSIEA